MYRHARGQSGQGSLSKAAWGSGPGARSTSPEPGGIASSGGATTNEAPKERQDEVILQLESELFDLRNQMAWKDQRIAALARTETPVARLKRDARQLASELRQTRKQLSESQLEKQELSEHLLQRKSGGHEGNNLGHAGASGAAPAAGGDSSRKNDMQLRERVLELMEENRQLRETVMQLGTRASHQQSTSNSVGLEAATAASAFSMQQAASETASQGMVAQPEENWTQLVYSNFHQENTKTLGPTHLQGIGLVDGVASVARVLLQQTPPSIVYRSMHA